MEPLDWAAAGLKVGLLVLVQSELKKLRERAHGLSFHKVPKLSMQARTPSRPPECDVTPAVSKRSIQ
jgi:hypothetical protein